MGVGHRLIECALHFRQAKISQLHLSGAGQQDVGGLDVSVDQIQPSSLIILQAVCIGQCLQHLYHHIHDNTGRNQLPGMTHKCEQLAQIAAIHMLHRDEVLPLDLIKLMNLEQSRMLKAAQQGRFPDEHLYVAPILTSA